MWLQSIRGRAPVLLAALVLAGCSSIEHARGFREMTALHQALVDAARAQPISATRPAASAAALGVTVGAARRDLAIFAMTSLADAQQVGRNITEYDRISVLYRAAIAAWHAGDGFAPEEAAGDIDIGAPAKIAAEAERLCSALGDRKPERDCAIATSADRLNKLEANSNRLVAITREAERLGENGSPADQRRLSAASIDLFPLVAARLEELEARIDEGATKNVLRSHYTPYLCEAVDAADMVAGRTLVGPTRNHDLRRAYIGWVSRSEADAPSAPGLIADYLPRTVSGDMKTKTEGGYRRIFKAVTTALGKLDNSSAEAAEKTFTGGKPGIVRTVKSWCSQSAQNLG